VNFFSHKNSQRQQKKKSLFSRNGKTSKISQIRNFQKVSRVTSREILSSRILSREIHLFLVDHKVFFFFRKKL